MMLFLTIYYLFVEVVPVVNTMVNPLIYSFSNREFRGEVARLWERLLPNKSSTQRGDGPCVHEQSDLMMDTKRTVKESINEKSQPD